MRWTAGALLIFAGCTAPAVLDYRPSGTLLPPSRNAFSPLVMGTRVAVVLRDGQVIFGQLATLSPATFTVVEGSDTFRVWKREVRCIFAPSDTAIHRIQIRRTSPMKQVLLSAGASPLVAFLLDPSASIGDLLAGALLIMPVTAFALFSEDLSKAHPPKTGAQNLVGYVVRHEEDNLPLEQAPKVLKSCENLLLQDPGKISRFFGKSP